MKKKIVLLWNECTYEDVNVVGGVYETNDYFSNDFKATETWNEEWHKEETSEMFDSLHTLQDYVKSRDAVNLVIPEPIYDLLFSKDPASHEIARVLIKKDIDEYWQDRSLSLADIKKKYNI